MGGVTVYCSWWMGGVTVDCQLRTRSHERYAQATLL